MTDQRPEGLMGAYLIDNPPRRAQFRARRADPSGVAVVHTAENVPDTVATDGSAEGVARFIRDRRDAGSYHDLTDSDSIINLVPYELEAFGDGTGSNPHAYHLSVATTAAWWPLAPQSWRDGAVEQAAHAAARYARWLKVSNGIVIPARRISRAESSRGVPGFISHAERDPGRRSDPGALFPWDPFLARFAALTASTVKEDPDMAVILRVNANTPNPADDLYAVSDFVEKRPASWPEIEELKGPKVGLRVVDVSKVVFDGIPNRRT